MATKQPTITGEWHTALMKVMDSLGDENYSFYNIDVTKTADPEGRSSIYFAMKVIVPRSDRTTAANFIQNSLIKKGFAPQVKRNGNQLDIPVKNKFIRIDIKPVGGGSGAGAKETARNEAAQCLYCALAFNVYKGKIDEDVPISEDALNQAFNTIDVDVKHADLMLLPQEWVASSIRGANKLWDKFHTTGKTYRFHRGKGIDDKEIKNAFARVRPQTPFSSEDKWNPADIWIVSNDFNATELNDIDTIDALNHFLLQEYAANRLIGVSLKKITGQGSLSEKNKDQVAKANQVAKYGLKNVGLIYKNDRGKDKNPMDMYLFFGTGTYDKFQARNFGGANSASFQLELKGASANQGRIGGGSVFKILDTLGVKYKSFNNQTLWSQCAPRHAQRATISQEICDLLTEHNATGLPKDCTQVIGEIANMGQSYRYSKLLGLRLLDAIKKSGKADDIMRELYLYGASQSSKSGFYLKLE